MGIYYNPGEEVQRIGRKLDDKGNYDTLQSHLKEGELLFCVSDVFTARTNPIRALYVETKEDFIETMKGKWQCCYDILGFYALTREQAEKGCHCNIP